jgi:carbon monoxide dehydrogenase subunit G
MIDPAQYTSAPLRAEATFQLDAPPKEVWALMSDHEAMPSYMPMVHKVTVDNSKAGTKGGVGAVRTCSIGDDAFHEEIRLSKPNEALGYSVLDGNAMGFSDHFAVVLLAAGGDGGTTVQWKLWFNHPEPGKMAAQVNQMLDMVAKGLAEKFAGA